MSGWVVRNYFVAYTLWSEPTSSEGPFSDTYVRWVDLRHGRRLSPATGCDYRRQIGDGNLVRSFVLSFTGAMAWVCNDVVGSEVHKLDHSGASLLDSVTGQSDMSLALSDYPSVVTIYWTHYPGPRSANLIGFWAACCERQGS